MIRSRFNELVRELRARFTVLGIAPEQFSAEIVKLKVEPGGHGLSEDGNHLCTLVYSAEIAIERLPKANLALLAVIVAAQLEENDDTRSGAKDGDPEFTVVDLDGECCDVICAIDFRDPVHVAPVADPGGDVVRYLGRLYAVRDFAYDIAEDGAVEGAPLFPEGGG